ncbi:MAG TPA: hypothetical protein VNZ54_07280 [bacterium]|jgi:hypothetical protein|nr:hypothetical protein [bacterium]
MEPKLGYRHKPLSQRLGLGPVAPGGWRVDLPEAECFMYFVAHLNRLFGRGRTLYVEGLHLDPEVLELYLSHPAEDPRPVAPVLRHPGASRLHVALGGGLAKPMNRLAARKTFAQMGEVMLVYGPDQVWLDGRALGERRVDLSGEVGEPELRRFAGGLMRGIVTRLEA